MPATPSAEQLSWQDLEVGMFFHFDILTYAPGWNFRSWANHPDPSLYNPSKFDADQWMEAAKAIGARYAVLVAKHCSGFLQWQSDLYPYGVRQSPWRDGKGDLVEEFVAACRRHGLKPGLYASVSANGFLEVDNPGRINRGQGGDEARQAEYTRICEGMLTELWSRYGDLTEIWFDGGALPPNQGGPDLLPILHAHQPKAIIFQGPAATIRWIGNEKGVAGYPCWATVPGNQAAHDDADARSHGDPDGTVWMPGECDVPVRNHEWFWTPDAEHKLYPLDDLVEMYYHSVGRNCNMLLNANPNPDGLVPEADLARYIEFGREIRRRFATPIAHTSGTGAKVTLALPRPQRIDHVVVMEDITAGERIREYVVEGLVPGNTWQPLCTGTSVGHKRIEQFAPIEVASIRLRATHAVAEPRIRSLSAHSCCDA